MYKSSNPSTTRRQAHKLKKNTQNKSPSTQTRHTTTRSPHKPHSLQIHTSSLTTDGSSTTRIKSDGKDITGLKKSKTKKSTLGHKSSYISSTFTHTRTKLNSTNSQHINNIDTTQQAQSTILNSDQTGQSIPTNHTSDKNQNNDDIPDDEKVQLPPPKFRFPIPPQKLKRLPYQSTIRDNILNPLAQLDPSNFVYPDYALLTDFNEKESLLDWKIITDGELNGTSEASIAWGSSKNPITGEPMRTLVFQGRLGEIILPKETMNVDKAGGLTHIISNTFKRKKTTTQDDHAQLVAQAAQDKTVDFGDYDPDDPDSPFLDTEYGAVHGFVGLMSPPFSPPLDLHFWDTLNICTRTDSGPWLASVKPVTTLGQELYVAGISGPNGTIVNPRKTTGFLRKPMRNLFVPFNKLSVTKAGRGTHELDVNSRHIFEGFGFSIRGPAGPFKIEIGWIAVANSTANVYKELHGIAPPVKTIKVELTPETIEKTSKLNDIELYRFAHNNKEKFQQMAQDDAVKHAQATQSPYTGSETISIDDVNSNKASKNLRKRILAEKLGVDMSEIKDIVTPHQATIAINRSLVNEDAQNLDDDDAEAHESIDKMNQLLETTHTRADRKKLGLTRFSTTDSTTDSTTGEKLSLAQRLFSLTSGDARKLNAVVGDETHQQEAELLLLQEKAKKLTGIANPLILPVYSDEHVMAQARINALQQGLMTEKQWESYTTTGDNANLHQLEAQLQSLRRKQFKQAFEHTYSETSAAEKIRKEREVADGLAQEEMERKREEDEYYNEAGYIPSTSPLGQEPPADIFEAMERSTSRFKGTPIKDGTNYNFGKGNDDDNNNGNGVKH